MASLVFQPAELGHLSVQIKHLAVDHHNSASFHRVPRRQMSVVWAEYFASLDSACQGLARYLTSGGILSPVKRGVLALEVVQQLQISTEKMGMTIEKAEVSCAPDVVG